MKPLRVTFNQAYELPSSSHNNIRECIFNDPIFPKAYKSSSSKRVAVYFDYAELVAWHNNQKIGLRDDSIKVDLSRDDLRKLTAKDTRHNQSTNTILVYMRSPRNSLLASLHLMVKITSCIIEIVRMCFF